MDHFPTGQHLAILSQSRTRRAHRIPARAWPFSANFSADKPLFAHVAEEFLEFIGDAPLVIHNASFDMKFINAELTRVGRTPLSHGARHRHDRDRQAQDPRRALFAGRAVQALRHRSVGAHQAWRAAGRRADGAGLSGTGGRAAARVGAGARRDRRRDGGRRKPAAPASGPRRLAPLHHGGRSRPPRRLRRQRTGRQARSGSCD